MGYRPGGKLLRHDPIQGRVWRGLSARSQRVGEPEVRVWTAGTAHAATPSRAQDAGLRGQPAHSHGLVVETKRRAAVNRRPAGSKWMRSGSPARSQMKIT